MAPAGSSVAERDDPCCAVAKQNLSGRASETEKGLSQGALFRFTVSPGETSGTPDDVGMFDNLAAARLDVADSRQRSASATAPAGRRIVERRRNLSGRASAVNLRS